MSYAKKKNKRSAIGQLKKYFELALIKFFYKKANRKEQKMSYLTKKVTDFLRSRSKLIRKNNLRINEWTDKYIESCFMTGKSVNILTPWCLSKAFEKRLLEQGGFFVPTKKEKRVIEKEIPEIISVFLENGFRVNWWITFNRPYVDSRLLPPKVEKDYIEMISALAKNSLLENILFVNWEDEIIMGRSKPQQDILDDFNRYVNAGRLATELQRWQEWAKDEAGINVTEEQLKNDAIWQIACEAEEGQFLMGNKSPFAGDDFMLAPLESPERLDNFSILAKDLKKRIVAVLTPYPWRMKI